MNKSKVIMLLLLAFGSALFSMTESVFAYLKFNQIFMPSQQAK